MRQSEIDLEQLNRFNILYIEDDPDLLKHTASILEDFSAKTFAVRSCEEAWKVLESERVDVILADILLENENGLECIRKIRERFDIDVPVIMATAYTDTEFLLEAIRLHVRDYLVKPINLKELLQTLYAALLPRIQEREMERNRMVIHLVSLVSEGKQVELVRYIVGHLDDEYLLHRSYAEIVEETGISKPTVVKVFRQLMESGVLSKVRNGIYRLHLEKVK